ncbi:sensor histidine kinase [Microbacterium sp. CJ88]|uniref:sensor histidine kinase n=1 Tax=Microbacterium sp. CJ88 TaxID=3445672 RepID=UPI003F6593AA
MSDPSVVLTPSRAAAWLARGVTATWWYTAGSVMMFALMTVALWLVALIAGAADPGTGALIVYGAGAVVWFVGVVGLLLSYRRRALAVVVEPRRHLSAPTVGALVAIGSGAVVLGVVSGSVLLGAAAASVGLCLLTWMPGVRLRVTIVVTLVLVVLWIVEAGRPDMATASVFVHLAFAAVLPSAAVASLWWWDVVVELDRARAVESRLAAVQERLRLAGDLHDLQGHHLQVIALQLELAERMLPRDPAAAAEQVRLARTSVDEARRGTRELAGRFRGVPLPDELANAADLLRAAGLRVDLELSEGADAAPADVLGPVVRECTTNVLKHGGGRWARLGLVRGDGRWWLSVANDVGPGVGGGDGGAGLDGIADRVAAVGGELHHAARDDAFEVVVTVPEARGAGERA